MSKRLFTSESVTEGHPDKIADQISDAILDSLLAQDKTSRVAVETLITTGQVHVAGEVTTSGYADVMGIVRDTVIGIGYDSSVKGLMEIAAGSRYQLANNRLISHKESTMPLSTESLPLLIRWIYKEPAIRVLCSGTHVMTPQS
jgi:hypothetical protein